MAWLQRRQDSEAPENCDVNEIHVESLIHNAIYSLSRLFMVPAWVRNYPQNNSFAAVRFERGDSLLSS